MKKLIIIVLCLFPLVSQAQIPVIDGLSNKKLLDQIVKWVQDYAKQHGQQVNIQQIFGENKTSQEKITALLALKQQIEKHLYSTSEFKKLRISDLSKILEEVYGLSSTAAYGQGLPYAAEYSTYLDRASTPENARALYNYLFSGTGAYRPETSGTLDNYVKAAKEQQAKVYSIHVAAQKRKMVASMAYKRLSERFTEIAQDLSGQINAEGEHRMSTGERIKAQKMAHDYLVKSLEMKHKADLLMKEAIQKTPLAGRVDQSRQHFLTRKTLAQLSVY